MPPVASATRSRTAPPLVARGSLSGARDGHARQRVELEQLPMRRDRAFSRGGGLAVPLVASPRRRGLGVPPAVAPSTRPRRTIARRTSARRRRGARAERDSRGSHTASRGRETRPSWDPPCHRRRPVPKPSSSPPEPAAPSRSAARREGVAWLAEGRIAELTPPNAMLRSNSAPAAVRTSIPAPRLNCSTAARNRVFPIPAGPITTPKSPVPAAVARATRSRTASSRSRSRSRGFEPRGCRQLSLRRGSPESFGGPRWRKSWPTRHNRRDGDTSPPCRADRRTGSSSRADNRTHHRQ